MSLARNDPRHGTVNGYVNLKCRCARCKQAWADYVWRNGYSRKWKRKDYARKRAARLSLSQERSTTP